MFRLGSLSLDGSSSSTSGGDTTAADRLRQQQPSEFVIQKEDFPALSSYISTSSNDKSNTGTSSMDQTQDSTFNKRSSVSSSFTSSVHDNVPRTQQQGGSIGSRGSQAAAAAAASGTAGMTKTSTSTSTTSSSTATSNNNNNNSSSVSLAGGSFGGGHFKGKNSTTSGTALDANNLYGLLGMLHTIIRPGANGNEGSEKKNLVAIGFDLTSLGLNLNSSEPLLPTFASPWAEGPATTEPQFTLPMCYFNQPPVLKTTHLNKFHLETLFYIFYMLPKDILQAYAAQELYTREWRYHMELKLWLKRATSSEITSLSSNSTNSSSSNNHTNNNSTNGGHGGSDAGSGESDRATTTTEATSTSGQQQFIYFDTNTWERRLFAGGNISTTGLLSEEEVRVKFNNPPTS
jgi:CCR4-NOT transcription complex subunit 2